MLALIDADILSYEFGGMVQLEDPSKPLEWEILRSLVDDRLKRILCAVNSEPDECKLYLTDSALNFRNFSATILPYKGHRTQEKPYHWGRVRQHLIDNWGAEVQYGIEADDRLGIEQVECLKEHIIRNGFTLDVVGGVFNYDKDAKSHTVICSRDKDLHMIPGWHYQWQCGNQKEKLWFQDDKNAIRCFYKQLLIGDSTDNILGLYRVGHSSQLVKEIDNLHSEKDMFDHVFNAYQDRFGSYAYQFMVENGILLWMLRKEPSEQGPELELINRFDNLVIQPDEESQKENT